MRNSFLYILLMLLLLVSCSDKEDTADIHLSGDVSYERIAVVMPLSASEKQGERLRRTVEWASRNILLAQMGQERCVNIDIEWYDEDREDIHRLSENLAGRSDIKVVIGPYYVENAQIMSGVFGQVNDLDAMPNKVMICPRMCSDNVVRQFNMSASTAKLSHFLWALSETDITQCEVLLSKAYNEGAKTVGLLASDDMYGNTFYNWFAYQALEMGMTPVFVEHFDEDDMSEKISSAMSCGADFLVCTPSDTKSVKAIIDAQTNNALAPKLLFGDAGRTDEVLKVCGNSYFEGVSLCADPQSGFIQGYSAHFNDTPTAYESLLYDAVMLAAYSLLDAYCEGDGDVSKALDRLLESSYGSENYVWDEFNMCRMFQNINERRYINIAGASGTLNFDRATFSNVTSSTYSHWCVYKGQFVDMEYVASEGNNRVSPTMGSWNWKTSVLQQFANNTFAHEYPTLHERWAVVLSASSGWFNYRHHADALSVYQLLKKHGYDDDHIILIVDDNVAYDSHNPLQGEIRNSMDGENLYHDLVIDYNLKDLTPEDFQHILYGESDVRLTNVLGSDDDDNVFVYWVGHGLPDVLLWGYDEKTVTSSYVKTLQENMVLKGKYRKMMWITETCFSGSVMQGIKGYDGCMAMCSASDNEQSWAENNDIGTWMTNRFTRIWRETVTQNPNISYNDLYTHLAKGTVGSHVKVINEDRFDNMYKSSMADFLVK